MLALPPTYGAKTGEGSRTALSTSTQDAVKNLPLVYGAGGPPAERGGLGLGIHQVPGARQPGVSPLHATLNRAQDTAFAFVFLLYRPRNRLQMAGSPPQTLGAPLGRPLGSLQCPSPATLSKQLEWPFHVVWVSCYSTGCGCGRPAHLHPYPREPGRQAPVHLPVGVEPRAPGQCRQLWNERGVNMGQAHTPNTCWENETHLKAGHPGGAVL